MGKEVTTELLKFTSSVASMGPNIVVLLGVRKRLLFFLGLGDGYSERKQGKPRKMISNILFLLLVQFLFSPFFFFNLKTFLTFATGFSNPHVIARFLGASSSVSPANRRKFSLQHWDRWRKTPPD